MNNNIPCTGLFGKTRQAVLALLFGQPESSLYTGQIIEALGSGHGAVQRELKNLADAGVITREARGRQVYYRANENCPVFSEIKSIAAKTSVTNTPAALLTSGSESRRFNVPKKRLAEYCRRHHIKKLSLFGSVLRDDFRPDSDIDVLVEFEPGKTPGFAFVSMEDELSRMARRKVDLRTPRDLSHHFRDRVVREAKVQYDAGNP
jgi:predicted nucleotidyltransferase